MVAAGETPVAAEPAYDLPQAVINTATATALVLLIERRIAAVYGDLIEAAEQPAVRALAVNACSAPRPPSSPGAARPWPSRARCEMARSCPCGLDATYDDCCGRLHQGRTSANTAEQLMRSRYSAFVVGDVPYLLRSWHSSARPPDLQLDPDLVWTGLEIREHHRRKPVPHRREPSSSAHTTHSTAAQPTSTKTAASPARTAPGCTSRLSPAAPRADEAGVGGV